jgi:AraC-like DNA-binding protein
LNAAPRPNLTLVKAAVLEQRCQRSRLQPSPDLAAYVSVAWTLHWHLAVTESFSQRVLPNPCIHIVVEPRGSHVLGVVTGAYSTALAGSGFVLGLKFRPGGFYPFAKRPIAELTDRKLPLANFFPDVDTNRLQQLAASSDGRALMEQLECLLRKAGPSEDSGLQLVHAVVDRIAQDGAMLTVEDAAFAFSLSPRALQRLFRTYVGVGPKWAIRRYRLQEAVARVEAGGVQNWTELARMLGYFDQAHFTNEFTNLVGQPPAEYLRSRRDGSSPHTAAAALRVK